MRNETGMWGCVPYVCYGETSDQVCLFLHGQCGYKEEAERFAQIAVPKGWQVVGIDLPEHGQRQGQPERLLPWTVVPELRQVWGALEQRWQRFALRANSIGAWFALLALAGKPVERCLFVSPVVDMENMIQNMMTWAGVTEERLQAEVEIPTEMGQTLSWDYLTYVRQHPVHALCPRTEILYGDRDDLVLQPVVERFAQEEGANLTVVPGGEHWFHTPEQLAVLGQWEERSLP